MIIINGQVWKIRLVSPNHPIMSRSDGVAVVGCCDNVTKTIYIDNTISDKTYQKEILCHELTHAAMFSYDVDLNYNQEELVAKIMATYGEEIISITNSNLINLENQ